MKTIGLIGGMSWESTIPYYKIINEEIKTKLGGLHSAKIMLYSVDFDEIEKCQSCGNWEKSTFILGEAAKKLEISRSRFYFSLHQHNAQSLYADPVNDKNSCDPYCRCNSFQTEKKKNFQCRTSWNNELRRIFHQHDQQPLRLGAKKTEGAQKDCRK